MSSSEEPFFTAPIPCDLLCPICSDILKNPVLTPCQHLFCEQDLLQWFCRAPDDQGERPSQRCPQCNTVCAPDSIKPAGRLLCNILGDLERRCAVESCTWTGKNCDYARHYEICSVKNSDTKQPSVEEADEKSQKSQKSQRNSREGSSTRNSRKGSSTRNLRVLYLRRQLEEAAAEQREASRQGSKEKRLLHRQLAELVQHNKNLSERSRELDRQVQQYKERCNILERALLGQEAVDSFDKAREDSLREARKYME